MSGSIFDMLTDPTTSALMGLAQGFGQSAMPTRMPTPIGAVLGQGIGGLQQGLATGQALRKGDIQNQQAKIGLDWYKNMVNPQGQGGGGLGQNVAFGAPTVNANGQYITSPQMLNSLAMMLAGQSKDPTGPLKLLQAYAEQGRAITPEGTIFQIPGGTAAIAAEAAAKAGGTKAAESPYVPPTTYDMPVLGPNGQPVLDANGQPTFRKHLMSPVQANQAVNGGTEAPQRASGEPPAADPFPTWAQRINHGENATGNPNAKNASGPGGTPTSSAMGNGQFLEGTWPGVIRAVRPDIAAGKTDAELLPLRGVPGLAQSATEQYARQNGATLAQAGLPVNGATVGLAHFLGPQGAMTVLNAKPDAPLAMLPGMAPVVNANPSLKGITAGALVQQYQRRMGDTAQVAGPGAPQTAANVPVQIPPTTPVAAPMAGAPMAGVPGMPVLTPQQELEAKNEAARHAPTKISPGENYVLDPSAAAKGPPGGDNKLVVPGVAGGALESPFDPRGETAGQKVFAQVQTKATEARYELQQAQLLRQKMHELGATGPATPFLANLDRYAEQLGVPESIRQQYHLPKGGTETEAAALANSLMMEVAKTNFPNRITNADLTVAKTVKPNPAMPLAAADFLLDNTIIPHAQRDIDRYQHIVPLNTPKLPNGEINPHYDRELRGIHGALDEFDTKRPPTSYTPALQPKPAEAPKYDPAAVRAEMIKRGLLKQ